MSMARPEPPQLLPSPKQSKSSIRGRAAMYPYYAGYTLDFVEAICDLAQLKPGDSVLDPWNGAGTTTQAAHDRGLRAFGFDINPVASIVARARLHDQESGVAAFDAVAKALTSLETKSLKPQLDKHDPLNDWFAPASAGALRQLERALSAHFELGPYNTPTCDARAAVAFTVLFRSVRRMLSPLSSKNPTWVKRPKLPTDRIKLTRQQVLSAVRAEAAELHGLCTDRPCTLTSSGPTAVLHVSPADRVPLPDESIDLVVTSPPYCTRIDYAASLSPELSLLGFDNDESLRHLRDAMTGTSTIRRHIPTEHESWGPTCLAFLDQLASHPSKASKSYYLKTHRQYFFDLAAAFNELSRCIRRGGMLALVVQDSYYKNIHNDLAQVCTEMLCSRDFRLRDRHDFRVVRSMVSVNQRAKRYRDERSNAESVLMLAKL